MGSKFLKVLLPTLAGFIVLAGLMELDEMFHANIYSANPNYGSGPQIDIPLYIVLVIPFFFALLFQSFAVLPFWAKMKNNQIIFGLQWWQVIGMIAVLPGLVAVLIGGYKEGLTKDVFVSGCSLAAMFVIYWIPNFLTLALIDKVKYSR